jgi:hypothetical protein
MTEWISLISLALSILGLLLEREKLARLYADFYSWQSQRKQKQEGEQFIKKIQKATDKGDTSTFTVFIILLFLLTISSGLASLLKVKTLLEVSAVGTIPLSILLWFSIRGLIREAEKIQLEWYVTAYTIIMFQFTVIGLALVWGFTTLLFITEGFPNFWAGMAGTITFLAIAWFMLFIGKHSRGAS